MASSKNVKMIVKLGVEIPHHRHGTRSWHWAWSSHDGVDAKADPIHAGIYRKDPRTPDEVKLGVGHGPSLRARRGQPTRAAAVAEALATLAEAPVNDPEFAIG